MIGQKGKRMNGAEQGDNHRWESQISLAIHWGAAMFQFLGCLKEG
jgi:hypothetical protein